jgi:hypothetical protein
MTSMWGVPAIATVDLLPISRCRSPGPRPEKRALCRRDFEALQAPIARHDVNPVSEAVGMGSGPHLFRGGQRPRSTALHPSPDELLKRRRQASSA